MSSAMSHAIGALQPEVRDITLRGLLARALVTTFQEWLGAAATDPFTIAAIR